MKIQTLVTETEPLLEAHFLPILLSLPQLVEFRLSAGSTQRYNRGIIPRGNLVTHGELKLQALQVPSFQNLPTLHPSLFKTLTSLIFSKKESNQFWRSTVELCSKTLKHLNIAIEDREGAGESYSSLLFPLL